MAIYLTKKTKHEIKLNRKETPLGAEKSEFKIKNSILHEVDIQIPHGKSRKPLYLNHVMLA